MFYQFRDILNISELTLNWTYLITGSFVFQFIDR